ncbi:MAG: helix-turn-helix domain-containing protein, partial [Streptomycetaceae bacterium]|nr:helix-turn-helix domain-containing protein [Streptomycetaceae bacterium]
FQAVAVHVVAERNRAAGGASAEPVPRTDFDAALAAAVRERLHAVSGERSLMAVGDAYAWVVLGAAGGPSPHRAEAFAEGVAKRFAALTGRAARVVVGAGPVVDRLDALPEAFDRAALAARAAAVLPGRDGFVRGEELGPYEVLLRIPAEDRRSLADLPAMRALDREDAQGVLAATLAAYFDNAGDVRRTAEVLCVHRATLYHRLRRIEAVTGCSLQDGDDRLTLHLGVKLRALAAGGDERP